VLILRENQGRGITAQQAKNFYWHKDSFAHKEVVFCMV
jgi:hypothetical protein